VNSKKSIVICFLIALFGAILTFGLDWMPDWLGLVWLVICFTGIAGTVVLLVWNLAKEQWLNSLLSLAFSVILSIAYYFAYWYAYYGHVRAESELANPLIVTSAYSSNTLKIIKRLLATVALVLCLACGAAKG
jgi:hypothetical protein